MTKDSFFANFGYLADAPNGVKKLRELILQLAVQGKLVPQDPADEPASKLLERIKGENARLVKEKKFKKIDPLQPVRTDEMPYKLPNGWEWVRLEQISSRITDGEHISPNKTLVGVPLLTAKNVSDKGLVLNGPQYVSKEDAEKFWERCRPELGDILICSRGTIGRCAVITISDQFCLMGSVILVKPFGLLSSQYVRYFLSTSWAQTLMRGMSGATAVQALYLKDIKYCPIALPPLAEQHRIVAKVDQLMALCDELETRQQKKKQKLLNLNNAALDRLLTARETDDFTNAWRLIRDNFDFIYTTPETIAKLRQSILQFAVQGKLVPQDPNDEPVSVLLAKIKAEKERLITEKKIKKSAPLPPVSPAETPFELPKGWEWMRFCDVARIASNLVKPALYSHYPHVAPDNIEKQTGKLLPYRTVQEDCVCSANHLFYIGQILYSKIRPNLSKVTIVNFGGLCSADMYPIEAHISPYYLLYYMLSSVFLEMAVKKDTRVAMPKINQEELNRILVPVSPLAEQHRIVAKVDQLMKLCDELESKLIKSQAKSEKLVEATVKAIGAG